MKSYDFLVQLLAEEFGVNAGELVPEASPAGLGLDSLSTMEMVRELEEEFGIKAFSQIADNVSISINQKDS